MGIVVLAVVLAACGTESIAGPEAGGDVGVGRSQGAMPDEHDSAATGDRGDGRSGAGRGLTAVAPLFALAWAAEQVAPAADTHFLLAGGGDPHDLELSPSERALLETAEVVVYIGEVDFMPQLESAIPSAEGEIVDVTAVAGDERLLDLAHGHDDDHDHGNHGEVDPHLWLDTGVMADVAVALGQAFAAADPDNADAYEANASALADEMAALTTEIDALLSGCTHDTVIVSHEAYAYLLDGRGIAQEGISGAGGHGEASPQRLAELSERIEREGIPAIAAEPLHGRADAEALAAESGADLVEINPLEDITEEHYDRGYPRMLLAQVESFATALDCAGGA